MRHIGLIGLARSGKDSVATHLVRNYGYTRVAFADAVKEHALKVDPWVNHYHMHSPDDSEAERLSEVVDALGWERAKRDYPEVRRILQTIGAAQRDHDPDYWIRIAQRKIGGGMYLRPIVVTDVRYLNEVIALQRQGFTMVGVRRPNAGLSGDAAQHSSETELSDYIPRYGIHNGGSLEALGEAIDALLAAAR